MKKHSRTPAGRLKELYERLERVSVQLTEEGETYETLSTQGDNVKKLNPLFTVYKDIKAEIRLIEVEEGKTAMGKERRKKLAAEAKKLSAEADNIGAADNTDILDFLS
ncbi:P27 family phage terminase small subunit [Vibrio parahaemolyticus]|nr:P27 family phage terminase small subunit [Vibrio parahaemolyticus]MDF4994587.1 hypothetical protein [Vibrio parahaemolyticus]HCH1607408.1 hypothetical protein [Vibrio parahaemolyticus]HCM0850425.1 hypothetical protein [Vibrio parahaemolyticus]